jgi:hypothetical protein
MHDRYAGKWYTSLSFTQTTDIRAANDSVTRQVWYEAASIPGRLRINRFANDDKNAVIFRGDSTYSRRNGGPWQGTKRRNELLTLGFDVYADPVARSARVLTETGYDLAKLGTATWHGRPVWVVGASTGDSLSRQFWVDQERLVYVRSLEPSARDPGAITEIVFGDYAPLAGGWIAREVTVTAGGKVIQRERYFDIKANVPAADSYFDPSRVP